MAKEQERNGNNGNQDELAAELLREREVVSELLYEFEVNGVNALVIMEKEDLQIIMGKGIRASTLVNFVVDLFLREPELYQATVETVQAIMMEPMEDVRKSKTSH